MLTYRAALPLSAQTLSCVAGVIRRHRSKIGSCWRKLNPGRQALAPEAGRGAGGGAVHDLTAARIWAMVRELADARLIVLADKGYIGAGEHVYTPTGAEQARLPESGQLRPRETARPGRFARRRAVAPSRRPTTSSVLEPKPRAEPSGVRTSTLTV